MIRQLALGERARLLRIERDVMKQTTRLPKMATEQQVILPQDALKIRMRGGKERAFIMMNTEREAERMRGIAFDKELDEFRTAAAIGR